MGAVVPGPWKTPPGDTDVEFLTKRIEVLEGALRQAIDIASEAVHGVQRFAATPRACSTCWQRSATRASADAAGRWLGQPIATVDINVTKSGWGGTAMRIVSRRWAWPGWFGRRRPSSPVIVPQMSAVELTRSRKEIDDQRQKEIEFLRKVLAVVTTTKVDDGA